MWPLVAWLRRSLWDVVPRDRDASPEAKRRRRAVTAAGAVVGGVSLAFTLRLSADSPWFYPATLALAAVYLVAAFCSGPIHLGRIARRGELTLPWGSPIGVAILLAAIFTAGAAVVRELPYLGDRVAGVMHYASSGSLPVLMLVTALNGVAEEMFFRGALYAALPRDRVLWSTVGYTLVTLATGNVMLAFAAAVLGTVTGLERRASGGVLAPILTHVVWSLAMLLILPALFPG